MTDKFLVSVIVPIYNTEKYVKRCLDSIINQKYMNLEIILVDDGSSDRSGEICDQYAGCDQRIKVIHKENEGLVAARKTGLKEATGDYVSYIDSDDWIEDGAYQELVNIAKKYDPDFIDCFFYKDFKGVTSIRRLALSEGFYDKEQMESEIEKILQIDPPFVYAIHSSLCSKLIRRSFLVEYQNSIIDELMLGEDFSVSFQLLMNANSIYVSHTPYYHYCVRETSMTYDDNSSKYDIYKQLNSFVISRLPKKENVFHRYFVQRTFDLMFDYLGSVPENYFEQAEYFPFYKDVKRNSRVLVYGKGLYAKNIINIVKRNDFLVVVDNIDSVDAKEKLALLPNEAYDFIMIAIADHKISCEIRRFLMENGILEGRIKTISNKYLVKENLPSDILEIYNLRIRSDI